MRICWATDYEGVGNAYGHSVGNATGRQAALDAGIVIDPDATLALHHCPPHCFEPLPMKYNVLWAAWEFPELTPVETDGLKRADELFATARFLVDVYEGQAGRITTHVPQGIRTDLFTFKERTRPANGEKFRYLWVGAPNDRKGWRHAMAAWRQFQHRPSCELYVKSTFASEAMKGVTRKGNVTVDARRLSDAELVDLYHSAHCFVFPSMGEGFGFTLGEAMSTGLPCIYTPATSMTDLASRGTGFPLAYKWERCFDVDGLDGKTYRLLAANPDVRDIARQMRDVRGNYRAALRTGRRAAEHIRDNFTWAHSGLALKKALEPIHDAIKAKGL